VIIIFREYRKLGRADVLFPPTRGSAAFTLNIVLFFGKINIQVSVPAAQWPVSVNGATPSKGFFFKEIEERERERVPRDTLQFVFFAPLPFLTSTARSSSSSLLFTSSVDSSVPRKDVLKRASEQ
jgi:hypothetical protein